jgi:hypothetical protein
MINLTNIFSAPVILEPWEHQIIDNFFDEVSFKKIQKAAKIFGQLRDFDTPEIVWMNELEELGVEDDVVDIIVDAADEIIKNYEKISSLYSNKQVSELGYFNNPRFGVCPPNTINEIHDEGTNKTMALIVYIDPGETMGTLLYKDNDEESFVKEVEWKPNRALLMFSQPNVTWHRYNSKENTRVTLNFYYEKIEALNHLLKSNSVDKLNWLHSQFSMNKLYYGKL